MAKRVVTFGEIMMRLNPEGYLRLVQADKFEISFAGAEANVAVSLANYGLNSVFVSKIPANEIGECVIRELRRNGVDVSNILRGGDRLGVFFLEKGASQRASKVIYDRAYSAIAISKASEYDWDSIFCNTSWFHWTGITPALSDECAKACHDACIAAKERGITVSCDLNYRKKLWSHQKAGSVMSKLMPYVDVCIANEEDAKDVFGIASRGTDIESGILNREGYVDVARQISERFGCKKVAVTLRGSITASDNEWGGMLYDNENIYFSRSYRIHIVDRVGGGDSFCGGLIYSLISGFDNQYAVDFATAASCLKHTIEQDFNLVSIDEVESLVRGSGSGRVRR
jgi:2-dehydro-3-deoxygluconokinase